MLECLVSPRYLSMIAYLYSILRLMYYIGLLCALYNLPLWTQIQLEQLEQQSDALQQKWEYSSCDWADCGSGRREQQVN